MECCVLDVSRPPVRGGFVQVTLEGKKEVTSPGKHRWAYIASGVTMVVCVQSEVYSATDSVLCVVHYRVCVCVCVCVCVFSPPLGAAVPRRCLF